MLREVLCELGVSTGIELPLENVWGHVNFKATVNISIEYFIYVEQTVLFHLFVQKSSEFITKLVISNIYNDNQNCGKGR